MMPSLRSFARHLSGIVVGFGIALAIAPAVPAQTQGQGQARPTRIVVPFAVGGASDTYTRLVSQKVTEQTGKTIVVENRTGAGGRISFDYVAKSAPDGATIALIDATYAMLPGLFPVLPWDINGDLIPVVMIAQTPFILLVRADGPFKTFADLIAYARANPGKLNYGSAGVGSVNHIVTERFRSDAKIDITHIPYKGMSEASVGLLSGNVDLIIAASPTALTQIQGGKVRPLIVTTPTRSPVLPISRPPPRPASPLSWSPTGLASPSRRARLPMRSGRCTTMSCGLLRRKTCGTNYYPRVRRFSTCRPRSSVSSSIGKPICGQTSPGPPASRLIPDAGARQRDG